MSLNQLGRIIFWQKIDIAWWYNRRVQQT